MKFPSYIYVIYPFNDMEREWSFMAIKRIKHVLKDGTVLEDITGHIIKQESAPMVYQIIEQMEREEKENEQSHI